MDTPADFIFQRTPIHWIGPPIDTGKVEVVEAQFAENFILSGEPPPGFPTTRYIWIVAVRTGLQSVGRNGQPVDLCQREELPIPVDDVYGDAAEALAWLRENAAALVIDVKARGVEAATKRSKQIITADELKQSGAGIFGRNGAGRLS